MSATGKGYGATWELTSTAQPKTSAITCSQIKCNSPGSQDKQHQSLCAKARAGTRLLVVGHSVAEIYLSVQGTCASDASPVTRDQSSLQRSETRGL
eukprot:3939924-Rhodomonas_salina.1